MSKHIKALVVLNLQSYAGGRDLWGLRDPKRDAAKGWQTPIFNDGLIEVRGPACPARILPLESQLQLEYMSSMRIALHSVTEGLSASITLSSCAQGSARLPVGEC